jgi:hypothetical protein
VLRIARAMGSGITIKLRMAFRAGFRCADYTRGAML